MEKEEEITCGIIMPISSIGDYNKEHWSEVKEIICESVISAGFSPNIVSDSDDSGIIQGRIVQNLYNNPIAVCDVSGKNPNVMFELGMRLAFDKPTIIIKDNLTSYSFDTAPIEHLGYPADLRYSSINMFKETLSDKIRSTYKSATNDSDYTTFLRHFGEFTVAKLNQKEISGEEYLIKMVDKISDNVLSLSRRVSNITHPDNIRREHRDPVISFRIKENQVNLKINSSKININNFDKITDDISNIGSVENVSLEFGDDKSITMIVSTNEYNKDKLREISKEIIMMIMAHPLIERV